MISDAQKQRMHIGYKQSLRAITDGSAEKLLVAVDCEERMSVPLKKAAADGNVPVDEIASMRELGTLCGIDVGASCAVILKN